MNVREFVEIQHSQGESSTLRQDWQCKYRHQLDIRCHAQRVECQDAEQKDGIDE